MEIRPYRDQLVIRTASDDELSSLGITTHPGMRGNTRVGIVLAVGPGNWSADGKTIISTGITTETVVLFSIRGATEFAHYDKKRVVIPASDVLAILTQNGQPPLKP